MTQAVYTASAGGRHHSQSKSSAGSDHYRCTLNEPASLRTLSLTGRLTARPSINKILRHLLHDGTRWILVGACLRDGARGSTASRTREWLIVLAQKMGFDAVSVNVSIDAVSITAGRSGTFTTGMREVGPPIVDTSRIVALEQIAKNATVGVSPDEIATQLANLFETQNAFVFAVGDLHSHGRSKRRLCASQRRCRFGSKRCRSRRLDRPVAAKLPVTAALQPIRLRCVICCCSNGKLRSRGSTAQSLRLDVCALPRRLHRLSIVPGSWLSLDRGSFRPSCTTRRWLPSAALSTEQ